MTKSSSWKSFVPSFTFTAFGQLRDLQEGAFKAARPLADAEVEAATGPKVTVEGVLDANAAGAAGQDRGLNFGHQPSGNGMLWSNLLPYRLTIDFDENDEVEEVNLTIFLANPHFSLSARDFLPARVSADKKNIEVLAQTGGRIGFALVAAPSLGETKEQVYARLSGGLPAGSGKAPASFEDFDRDTLRGRLDLTAKWDKLAKKLLGAWVGIPGGDVTDPLGKLARLELFSSATDQEVQGFVHESRKFALRLPEDTIKAPTFILSAPEKPKDDAATEEKELWKAYRLASQELGLDANFKGFLLQGLIGTWIDDDLSLSSSVVSAGVDVLAVSFGGDTVEDGHGKVGFSLAMRIEVGAQDAAKPFLGWFQSPSALRIAYGQGGLRYLTLEGSFAAQLEMPYDWLSGRTFSLSVVQVPWKDPQGKPHRDWAVELGLEKTDDKYLARIPVEGDDTLSKLVVVLSFAPIIFMSAEPPTLPGPAPDAQSRGYFVSVQSGENIAQVLLAAALGEFLKEQVKVKELRITSAHLRSQPATINNSKAAADRLETALLLDYDVDYTVDLGEELGISTSRIVSTHIDGTGFAVSGDKVRWVQVPNGAYELGLSDPGLWDLKGLGSILKLTDIRLRRSESAYLVIRLRLAQNFGGVKANDFEFSVDLKSGAVKIEKFPAEVEVEVGSVFKGKGVLHIKSENGERDVAGSIDLAFKSLKWRIFGALRITHIKDVAEERHLALIASLSVEWPTKIPLLNTGFGIGGLQLLYATHFLRREPPRVGAVPPPLAWLKAAGGDVPASVANQNLWKAEYGRQTIGVGLEAGPMATDVLNINGLLAIDTPGPRIVVFVKVTLLEKPKKNKGNDKLTGGILGVLDINFVEETITLAAFADLKFGSMVRMNVPMELGGSMVNLSRWHIYLGHFDTPVTIDFKVFSLIKAGVKGYLMFDGDQIKNLPQENGSTKTLPGFAIAFGLLASVRIGGGAVYLEVSFKAFVEVSLSRDLYASGGVVLSGVIHLWKFDVGASGRWDFNFLRRANGDTHYLLRGSICGYIKVWRWKIQGCVGVTIGSGVPDTTTLEDLIQGLSFVPGAQAILLGQGAFNPIDAAQTSGTPIGLDTILVISMDVPPALRPNGSGFAGLLKQPTTKAEFQLGTKKGKYTIDAVTLRKREGNGSLVDIPYATTPARWWRNIAKQRSGHPAPLALALLTRNPLNFENALLDPGKPGGVVDEFLGKLCDPAVPEQYAVYLFYPPLQALLEAGKGTVQGVLGTNELELDPGYDWIAALEVEVLNVPPNDTEAIHLLLEKLDGVQIPGLVLNYFLRHRPEMRFVDPAIRLTSDGFWKDRGIQICLAVPVSYSTDRISDLVTLRRNGTVIPITNVVKIEALPAAIDLFVDGMANWREPVRAFANLPTRPAYSMHQTVLVSIDLKQLPLADDPTELVIGSRYNDINAPESVVVGPVKLTPSSERDRVEAENQNKSNLKDELNDYLKGNDLPLLAPDSEYVVEVEYRKEINGGAVTVGDPFAQSFRTSDKPPPRLDPYLLASYPTGSLQRSMPTKDLPAVLFSTHDILRILHEYNAKLRVTITHDGGAPVQDSTGTIDWRVGEKFDPLKLRDTAHPPTGIVSRRQRGWKSATMEAIQDLVDAGKLPCLDAPPLDRALWIGFDVVLAPVTSYAVRFDLVRADGNLVDPEAGAFYSFAFTTGLYPSMSDLAAAVDNGTPTRRRLVTGIPPINARRTIEGLPAVTVVPDKTLEDALWIATAERQASSGAPDHTVLWQADGSSDKAVAVVLRSNEPILTHTMLPKAGSVKDVDGTAIPQLAASSPSSVWSPVGEGGALPVGVSGMFVSESGLSVLVLLDNTAGQQDLVIKQKRHWSWPEGDGVQEERILLKLAAGKLRPRVSRVVGVQ